MLIEQFFDAGLGHGSYLVADPDAGVAFLVDPDPQIETYLAAAARLGVLITDSFETHIHNDYVSGSRALADLRPITVHAGTGSALMYPHASHPDGDEIKVGELLIRCVATPGHTPEHVAYLVSDLRRADDPQYLFSGGALLVGQIARVDLLGPKHAGELARAAYETLRERLLTLADYVAVFPTHGGGSACTAGVAGSRWTTLGFERRHNPIALAATRDFASFRGAIAEGLPVPPAYYPHVRAINMKGAALPDRRPLPLLREAAPADRAARRTDRVRPCGRRRGAPRRARGGGVARGSRPGRHPHSVRVAARARRRAAGRAPDRDLLRLRCPLEPRREHPRGGRQGGRERAWRVHGVAERRAPDGRARGRGHASCWIVGV